MVITSRAKRMALIGSIAIGIWSLVAVFLYLLPPNLYSKDIFSEYLLSKAVLNGFNPYLDLRTLTNLLLGSVPIPPLPYITPHLPHPTPHPPPVAVLFLPLGLLSYEQAAAVWLFVEIGLSIVSVYLLLRWFGPRPSFGFTLLATLIALAWLPFREDLALGQLTTLLLLLQIIAWQSLRSGKNILGGAMLGCMVAIKLLAWPLILFLVIRKNWRGAIAGCATAAAANLIAAGFMGFDVVVFYYSKVGSIVAPLYRAHAGNFSTYSIGWRLFDGTRTPIIHVMHAEPLIYAPNLALYVSLAAPFALLVGGLVLAYRANNFDISFGILVCVSILVSPIAWLHYMILLCVPLAIVWRQLITHDLLVSEQRLLIALGLLLAMPPIPPQFVELIFQPRVINAGEPPYFPFAASLFNLTPLIAMLGLILYMWRLDRVSPLVAYNKKRIDLEVGSRGLTLSHAARAGSSE